MRLAIAQTPLPVVALADALSGHVVTNLQLRQKPTECTGVDQPVEHIAILTGHVVGADRAQVGAIAADIVQKRPSNYGVAAHEHGMAVRRELVFWCAQTNIADDGGEIAAVPVGLWQLPAADVRPADEIDWRVLHLAQRHTDPVVVQLLVVVEHSDDRVGPSRDTSVEGVALAWLLAYEQSELSTEVSPKILDGLRGPVATRVGHDDQVDFSTGVFSCRLDAGKCTRQEVRSIVSREDDVDAGPCVVRSDD